MKKKSDKEKDNIQEKDELIQTEDNIAAKEETPQQAEDKSGEEKQNDIKTEEQKEPTFQEKFDELNDKFLRLHAEFDNYRKRSTKERIDLCKTASEDVIKSLLPVFDDMERAIKSLETDNEINVVKEGISLIYNKFKTILKQKGIEDIKTEGEIFNTDFHEAVTNITVEEEEKKGKVIDVVEKGYMLNGKVIRFAKVVVGK